VSSVRHLLACLLCVMCHTSCVPHHVVVFVDVKDVPPRTPIFAAIGTERFARYDDAPTTLMRNGVVVSGERVIARLKQDDIVVIRATAGDTFGSTHLVRGHRGDPLVVAGAVLIVGGLAASLIGVAVCNNQPDQGGSLSLSTAFACAGGAVLGWGASLGVGIPMLVYGIRSETLVRDATKRVRLDVHPIRDGATAGVAIQF
jgi:hypothetical protein